MKVTHAIAGFAVITAWGCHTIVEELPSRPSPIRVGVQPRGTTPSPIPSSSPSPVALPSPSPTPAPSPSPSPSPNPGIPSPSPRPSPTPAPATLPASTIDHVRVGFFGINCGQGNPVPRNNERILPRGCRGYVTATPKDVDGHDVPAHVHGPDIEWFVLYGEDLVDVQAPTFRSDFNKDIVGVSEGSFGLCATVREVTGCLIGSVVPR